MFFLWEWWQLTIPIPPPDNALFTSYKESRELARNLWLAVASFLTFIYFGEYLKTVSSRELRELRVAHESLSTSVRKLETKLADDHPTSGTTVSPSRQ